MVIALQPPALVTVNNPLAVAFDGVPVMPAAQANRMLDLADPLNTGPPDDLLLTLQRLVI
ncbi:MAG TPA: hypothetical protein VG056_12775 [Pirellulales bacterium]|nr:hypothetical protein [Pirellulales bacterium]